MFDNPGWYAYLIDDDRNVIAHGYIAPRVASGEPGFAFRLRCAATQAGSVKGAVVTHDGEVVGYQQGVNHLDDLAHGAVIDFDIILSFNTMGYVEEFLADQDDVAFEDA